MHCEIFVRNCNKVDIFQVVGIEDDFLSLMAEDGSIREDVKFDPKVCNNKIGDTPWSLPMIQELIDEDGSEMPLVSTTHFPIDSVPIPFCLMFTRMSILSKGKFSLKGFKQ